MVSWHLRGHLSIPCPGPELEKATSVATAAIMANDVTALRDLMDKSFDMIDGLPSATAKLIPLQQALLSLLSHLGGTRPVGRAPAGGLARRFRER